jgi:TIGR03009 family protein
MLLSSRRLFVSLSAALLISPTAAAQTGSPLPGALQPPVGHPPGLRQPAAAQAPVGPPPEFQLNKLQETQLNLVLNAWQQESAKISTFRCTFERREFDPAFGPQDDIPLFINKGELSFERPDKGSFQITEVRKWQFKPTPPDQPRTGDWVLDSKAVGEHWVCDGKNVYEYRHDQKQLVTRPIPLELQGKAIVDGPLPFLFGADAAKLKQRYWMRLGTGNLEAHQVMIVALPRWPADAANYKLVEVVLDQPKMLPSAMQIHLPNNGRQIYLFDVKGAKINSWGEQIKAWFKPPEILPGWQRINEPLPIQQAAQPGQPPR